MRPLTNSCLTPRVILILTVVYFIDFIISILFFDLFKEGRER